MGARNRNAIYAVNGVDVTTQLAALPTAAVDSDTLDVLTKISNWIASSTEHAGSLVAELLIENKGDAQIVQSAHDLLGDLTAIRNSALLVEILLTRLHAAEKNEQKPAS